ncbi:hypothetical protein [Phytomonospora endophytica]|uniref:Uncharacterized protein n=1 Tax=Phytomonospora endophytica TaxID=714109 RepID=A0A841FW87_9ACTN|nr:hypothetical protein [Phytomonospora endophytica]MBB6037802.1 hypothetical protein [Phytomonospora endophytica]GIG67669.1 hypothetical protein Pen01_39640 [Phytomonospora endophytica]
MKQEKESVGPSGLKVDLDYLTEAGKVLLPRLATVHSMAAGQIHLSSRNDAGVMRRPGSGGQEESLAWAKWRELRDLLQTLAGETASNVDDSGMGLLRVVELYGGADAENVERLHTPVPPVPGDPLPAEAYAPREDL